MLQATPQVLRRSTRSSAPTMAANGAARLLLQTCDGANNRWKIYADLVSG